MKIIQDNNFQLNNDSAIVIGKFDGIHRGHRELLDRVIAKKSQGLDAVVFTFDRSPAELFSGKKIPSLTTLEEKRRIFEYLGVDVLIEYPLTMQTAAISPEDYITNILCKQCRVKYIAAGTDLSFGDKGLGDADLLKKMSCGKSLFNIYSENMEKMWNESDDIDGNSNRKYEVEIVDKIVIDNEEVSSSLIRDIVASGDMEKAANLIGVPYAVSGIVAHGRKLGRRMGFPTVNIEVAEEKLMPPFGVYFSEVSVEGRHFYGITNIGCKPTVTDSKQVFAETNILDFDEDVYGKRITVKLLHFSRPEQKFLSVEELRQRISIDLQDGRDYFSKQMDCL